MFCSIIELGNNYNCNVHQYCSVDHWLYSLNNCGYQCFIIWLILFLTWVTSFLHFDCKKMATNYVENYSLTKLRKTPPPTPLHEEGTPYLPHKDTLSSSMSLSHANLLHCPENMPWNLVFYLHAQYIYTLYIHTMPVMMYLIYYIIIVPWDHV